MKLNLKHIAPRSFLNELHGCEAALIESIAKDYNLEMSANGKPLTFTFSVLPGAKFPLLHRGY